MRSASKQIHYESLQELQLASKELASEDHRYQDKLKLIVSSAFGTDNNKGLIPPRIDYYYKKTPINWAEEHDLITRLFAPHSEIMSGPNGLLATADYPIAIDPKILPKSVLSEFPPRGDKQSTMLKSLKRELGEKYFINTWEWFWANLAHALVTLPETEEKRTMEEQEGEDEIFYLLTRNPLLSIVRKALQHTYRKQSHLLDRLRGIFELYIIEQLLSSTRNREGRPQYRYQLRSHHLGMMFLLINSRKHSLSGQTLQIYQEYFLNATEHYSAISAQNNNQNVRYLMRLWTFLLTREHGLDGNLVKQVQNANPRDGWYRLARCPLQKWMEAAKKTEFLSFELPVIMSIRNNFYRLLKKQTEWTPSFSFLSVLEQFLELDRTILHRYIKRHGQKEQDETITKCFERILTHLAQNGADCQHLQENQNKLNNKFKDTFGKTITINFAERSEQAKRKLSKTSRQNAKSISYQNPRIRNVWQHPLQQNEYYILLKGSLWVSKQLDKVIPGHYKRVYPCLNLRIFANPYIFFLTFLLLVVALRTYLME